MLSKEIVIAINEYKDTMLFPSINRMVDYIDEKVNGLTFAKRIELREEWNDFCGCGNIKEEFKYGISYIIR